MILKRNEKEGNMQLIKVKIIDGSKKILEFFDDDKKIFETEAFLGRNGVTINKKEGDLKTPIGTFNLGIVFGMHDIQKELKIPYIQINKDLYWVDDVNSRYYNQLVDIQKISKDWKSAEHLSDYPRQYEYAMEIKTNPENIPGNGSAIFLHCSVQKPTAGCVAIEKEKMLEILKNIKENALISIE